MPAGTADLPCANVPRNQPTGARGGAMVRRLALAIAAVWGAAGPAARAQCDRWIASPCTHAPFQVHFAYAAVYTPSGSTTPRLIAGGTTASFQGSDLHAIAQYDGSTWQAMGQGLDYHLNALLPWSSPTGPQLIATGVFNVSGAQVVSGIAAWNGAAWQAMGTGLKVSGSRGDGYALTTWDPDGGGPAAPWLIVGGYFDQAGNNQSTSNIAAWDGTGWQAIGGGLNNIVRAVTTWDADGSGPQAAQLIAAGDFDTAGGVSANHIASWDGTAWHPLGAGLTPPSGYTSRVRDLLAWDPDGPGPLSPVLVAAGNFSNAGGVTAWGIAYWDGASWHAMGTAPGADIHGLGTWTPPGGAYPQLVAGGYFADAPYPTAASPRIWDGTSWQPLGSDVRNPEINRFVTYDPDGAGPQGAQLVAAGLSNGVLTPNGVPTGLMRLVGNDWLGFDDSPIIYAATGFVGREVAGGTFEMFTTGSPSTPTPDAFNLAQWDGAAVTSVGGTNSGVTGTVRALKSFTQPAGFHNPELVVGGVFGGAGGVSVSNIAHYIQSIVVGQGGWFAMGQGFGATVYAIERFNNATYAGGAFINSGGTTVNGIARWDGTNWQPLTSSSTGQQGVNGTVYALKTYNGSLYAGGSFTSAAGLASGGLARWDGTNWSVVGGNFLGTVYALEVFNNELVIGGSYPGIAGSPNIAKYNGSTYSTLATGGTNLPVRALCVGPDGLLYVGGDFSAAGGVGVNDLARWNGTSWSDVRGAVNGPVYALQPFNNEVHAFGAFGKAAYSTLPSPAWARYTIDGVPWIAYQPVDAAANCVGADVSMSATLAAGYSPFTVTWRHNGTSIASGLTPWGSTVQLIGSGFIIHNAAPQDAGSYDVVFSTSCGNVTSTAATISVCYANCDCSTVAPTLNVNDFACFLNRFAAGDPYANCDGSTTPPVVNVLDFSCFLNKFAAGCP